MVGYLESIERQKARGHTQKLPVPERLPNAVQTFLVTRLAQFASPQAVKAEVLEVFELDLTLLQIRRYDASKSYSSLGRRHRQLFDEVRQRYLNDISDVGIAHQSHRLRTLQRLADKAEDREQWGQVQGILKQAAEEMGGTFTNQRTVTHKGTMGMVHLNAEDAKAELAQRLGTVLEQLSLPCPQKVDKDT